MHWAIRWMASWLLVLWALKPASPPSLAAPLPVDPVPMAPAAMVGGLAEGADVSRWAALLSERPSAGGVRVPLPAPPPADLSRVPSLLSANRPPKPHPSIGRQLGPRLWEVTPLEDWPHQHFGCSRIVPFFRNGQPVGFKLFGVRNEYVELGLKNGDVLLRINGIDLSSPEKALEIYANTKAASRIELELERDGRLVTHTYVITPPREASPSRPSTSTRDP